MNEKMLGEQLLAATLISDEHLAKALDRQREQGGRIGDNLVALGYLTSEQLAAMFRVHPAPPHTAEEAGLDPTFIAELVLKHASFLGSFGLNDITERVKLTAAVADGALDYLQRHKYLEVKGSADYTRFKYRYAITGPGSAHAAELLTACAYVGPAPVSLEAYVRVARVQTIKHIMVNEDAVRRAFAHLIVSDALLQKIGPAVSAGKSILIYGPPGNGKTTIAETLGGILPGAVYLPYAIQVGGQLIALFDPVNHIPAPPEKDRAEVDPRWVLCRRPVILAGGELTLRMLDLDFNTISKYYEAPLQLKANNGLFVVDDFGRQIVEPRQLLNRWIVPLERRTDFLTLHTGMKFQVPFDQLVVFSTNLEPADLVDQAFLRRIRYKIRVGRPTEGDYEAIFRRVCAAHGIQFSEDAFEHLLRDYYRRLDVPLDASHPREIVDHIVDQAHYRQHAPAMTHVAVASAWENHFVLA